MDSMILLVAMIAVFYFLIIRPENKRKKQAENMRNSLKKGERITTIGVPFWPMGWADNEANGFSFFIGSFSNVNV